MNPIRRSRLRSERSAIRDAAEVSHLEPYVVEKMVSSADIPASALPTASVDETALSEKKSFSLLSWISESHRWLHLVGGFAFGLLLCWQGALAAAVTAEVKDVQWNGFRRQGWKFVGFDWLDLICSLVGGAVGTVINFLVTHTL